MVTNDQNECKKQCGYQFDKICSHMLFEGILSGKFGQVLRKICK